MFALTQLETKVSKKWRHRSFLLLLFFHNSDNYYYIMKFVTGENSKRKPQVYVSWMNRAQNHTITVYYNLVAATSKKVCKDILFLISPIRYQKLFSGLTIGCLERLFKISSKQAWIDEQILLIVLMYSDLQQWLHHVLTRAILNVITCYPQHYHV